MAGMLQARRPSQGRASETTGRLPGPTQDPAAGGDNSERALAARTDEGTVDGLRSYQDSLGMWLGSELYAAVAPQLTSESLSGLATQGIDAAVQASAGAAFATVDGEVDEAAVAQFVAALSERCGALGAEWLQSAEGEQLIAALGGWSDAHPGAIATVALLAAGGAVLANMEIPELSRTFGLPGGVEAGVSAKVGRLQALALEQVKAHLRTTSGPLVAAVELNRDATGAVSGTAEASVGDPETRHLAAQGRFTDKGLELYGVTGLLQQGDHTLRGGVSGGRDKEPVIQASVVTKDGQRTLTRAVSWDAGSGTLTLEDGAELASETDQLSVKRSMDSTGAGALHLAQTHQTGVPGLQSRFGLDATQAPGATAYSLTEEQRLSLGMTYTAQDLAAELDGVWQSGGAHSLDGSVEGAWDARTRGRVGLHLSPTEQTAEGKVEHDFAEHTQGGLDLAIRNGDLASYEVGAWYGFKDPEAFSTWMAHYRYKSADRSQEVDLLVEERLGELYARFQHHASLGQNGMETRTSAHGAVFVAEDLALIAGLRHSSDVTGQDRFVPEVGMQLGEVPLTVGYDTRSHAVTVGLTLKFGR